MRGRPLCVASVLVIGILFVWHFFLSDNGMVVQNEEMAVTCQVEQIVGRGDKMSLIVCDVMRGREAFCERMKVYGGNGRVLFNHVKIGQILSLEGKVSSFSKPGNPGQFNEYSYYRELGISYKYFARALTIQNVAVSTREQALHELRLKWCENLYRCLPEEEAGIAAAMVFGEKSGLTTEIKELYKRNGIVHILAISGLHVSLLGAGVFFLLRRFVMPMKAAACLSAGFLLLYGEFTGFPIATRRAVIMMLCLFGARFLGKRYDRLSALALSAVVQLVWQPGTLFQSGFLLSYGTVLGIAVFLPSFQESWKESFQESVSGTNKIRMAVSGSLGISLITFPVLLYSYYEWNPYSVFVNVLILPLVSLLIILTLICSVITCYLPEGGHFFAGTIHYILQYYERICRLTEYLPFHQIVSGRPKWWQIILYYGLFLLFCFMANKKKRKGNLLFILLAVVFLLLPSCPDKKLSITNLDVGQGDCTCIRLKGYTMLIDGGSSDVNGVAKYRIVPFLKYYGIRELSYIFLTHSDSDHINGIREILEDAGHMGMEIGTVVMPLIQNPDEAYVDFIKLCRRERIPVKKMKAGDTVQIDSLVLRCLHPTPEYPWESENDYSLVLLAEFGNFHGLFTGDLESTGEQEIIPKVSKTDYLKVSHHGSKGASGMDLLNRIKPSVSVLSAGEGNRYGHPSKETLNRLSQIHSKMFCTMDCGAVTLYTDGEKKWVETFK